MLADSDLPMQNGYAIFSIFPATIWGWRRCPRQAM